MIPWPFRTKFLATHLPVVDRALLALGKQLEAAFTQAVDPVLSIAALAGFATVVSAWPEGVQKYVVTVRDTFTLTRTLNPLPVDGITIVAAGPANTYWVRDLQPSLTWGEQPTWYVNPGAVGNDEASGEDFTHPLKTFAEWRRRVGTNIPRDMTVNVMADLPITDPMDLDVVVHGTHRLTILGTTTPTLNGGGTLTGRTLRNPATNTPNEIVDATRADWIALVGKAIRFTMAGGGFAWAWIVKDIGGASHAARITCPQSDATWTSVERVLVGNEPYTVYDLTGVHLDTGMFVTGSMGDGSAGTGPIFQLQDFAFVDDFAVNTRRCIFTCDGEQAVFAYRCATDGQFIGAWTLTNCMLGMAAGGLELIPVAGVMAVFGGGSLGFLVCAPCNADKYLRFSHVPFLSQGNGVWIVGKEMLIHATDVGIFDSFSDGLGFKVGYLDNQDGRLRLYGATSHLYGSGNTGYGVNVTPGARVVFNSGAVLANVTITGTSGEVLVGGLAALRPDFDDGGIAANMPATAACATWAAIAAAPFNGRAFNHNNGAYIGP